MKKAEEGEREKKVGEGKTISKMERWNEIFPQSLHGSYRILSAQV